MTYVLILLRDVKWERMHVAWIKDMKLSSNPCNSTFLDRWSNIIICLTKSKIALDL